MHWHFFYWRIEMKSFPQVLKGSAAATGKNPARIGYGGPRYKKPTMPKMPWDDKEEKKDGKDINRK